MTNKFLILGSIILIGFGAAVRAGEAVEVGQLAGSPIAPMGDSFGPGGPWRKFHVQTIPQLGLPQAKRLIELELANRTNKSLAEGDSVNLLSALGQFAAYSRDTKNAIDYLSQATALREKNGDTKDSAYFYDLAGLAEAYLTVGDFNMAIEKFKLLIPLMSETNGGMNVYWLDLAQAYADAGHTQAAEKLCDQVLAAGPTQKPADPFLDKETILIGEWYRQRHKYAKAEQLFIKLIGSHWQKEEAEAELLKCFIEQRKIKKALLLLRQCPVIIELYPHWYYISFVRSSELCASFPEPAYSRPYAVPAGLKKYQVGLEALRLHQIKEAERYFRAASRSPDSEGKDLALLGLAKCNQLEENNEAMINLLADFIALGNKW